MLKLTRLNAQTRTAWFLVLRPICEKELPFSYHPKRLCHQANPSMKRPIISFQSMKSGFNNQKSSSRRTSFKVQPKKYVYKPLGPTKERIRLLRLFPSNKPSSPLRCALLHTSLADAPPYVALSYAWGDTTSKQVILISDEAVAITVSLHNALQRLRPKEEELLMWIDAICINQEDIPERSVQTANMRAIYQNAESVSVWLGLEYRESDEAIQLVHDLNACSSFEEVDKIVTDWSQENAFRALVKLFRRQYWWRVWVIQEVSCGKSCMVYCGKEEITWNELENTCDILKSHEVALQNLFYKNHSFVRTLITGGPRGLQLSRYSPLAAPPLMELLLSHKSKNSSDPRDKVYALVGISSSRNDFGQIDYSLPLSEIYSHTARHIISTTRKLDVICIKQHNSPAEGLPSWAPDWSRGPPNSSPIVIGLHHRIPEFTAAGNTIADVKFISDGRALEVSGFILGTISTIGMPLKRSGSPGDPIPALHVFHDWWNIFVAVHSSSPSEQAIFARTISCGNWIFDSDDSYVNKMEDIFRLSDGLLSDSDILRIDPPSRSSTISHSTTMTASVQSLGEFEEEEEEFGDLEERQQFSTILSAALSMNRRRLIFSKNDLVGLGPWDATKGDIICILHGCRFPVILRAMENQYTLIGETYIDGFMNGEGIDGLNRGDYILESFHIS